MAQGFKPCPRCRKNRIPNEWPQCGDCHDGWVPRDLAGDTEVRGYRYGQARLQVVLDRTSEVEPVADDETLEALQEAIIKRSRERQILAARDEIWRAEDARQQHMNLVERLMTSGTE